MPCGFGKILPIFKATDLVFWGLNEFSKVTKMKNQKEKLHGNSGDSTKYI